jgi:hypothetical protein
LSRCGSFQQEKASEEGAQWSKGRRSEGSKKIQQHEKKEGNIPGQSYSQVCTTVERQFNILCCFVEDDVNVI